MRLKAVLVCLASGAVAAVVACGDDGTRKLPDAPLGSDAAQPDAPNPLTPARLTITRDGNPVEGVDVFFQNPDFSLVAKVPTDATGVAEAVVMPGAYVTVVNPFAIVATGLVSDDLRTFAGVQPGDHLVLDQGAPPGAFTNFDVVVDEDATATQYKVWATCLPLDSKGGAPWYLSVGSGGTRPQGSPQLYNCGTKTDVLVESEDLNGTGVGYIFKDDAPVAAANASIDVAGPYTATPSVTLQFTDIPQDVFNLSTTTTIVTTDGPLWREDVSVGSGSSARSFEQPAPAGATQVYVTILGFPGVVTNTVVDWQPITTAPTFSLAAARLHPVTGAPGFDIATQSVTWPEDAATGVAADLAIAQLTAARDTPTPAAWSWRLVGPVTGAVLKYPTLPTELARFNPVETDVANVYDITLAKVPGGYNTVRAIALSKDLTGFAAGPSGRVLIERYFD